MADLHHVAFNETTFTHSNHSGSSPQPDIEQWFLTTIVTFYIMTFLIGCLGNTILCYVIYKRKERTRTIHLLTLNLAISDLMVLLIYLPMQIYQVNSLLVWNLGRVACKLFYGINAATINANIMTLIAITRDRYVAVTDPLTSHSNSTSSVKKWLLLIWSISIVLSLPLLIVVDAQDGFCYETWMDVRLEQAYWIILFLLQLVLPFIYFMFAYSRIVYRMRSSQKNELTALYDTNRCNLVYDKRTEKRKRQQAKLLRLAIILVVAYAVCVSPQHGVFFAFTYGTLAHNPNAVYIFIISNFLLIFNSLINPVVYASQSREMQRILRRLVCYKHAMTVLRVKRQRSKLSRKCSTNSCASTASAF